ncbi:hypothetical protein [Roseimicrobium gellanilyticum]|nr:hypothetical protein [Roseimicrobium gellanilyticum]
MDRTSKIVLAVVLCLVLSAGCAWIICTRMTGIPGVTAAPLIPVMVGCFLGSAVATALLNILDATRAALLASVLVACGLVIIPVLRKLELPKAVPYTFSASFFVGFFCSRLTYKED